MFYVAPVGAQEIDGGPEGGGRPVNPGGRPGNGVATGGDDPGATEPFGRSGGGNAVAVARLK
jgi:hypothetical protein